MECGIQEALLNVDGKGRLHLPIEIRKCLGIEESVIAEVEKGTLVIKPIARITDPVEFLSSLNIRTKKTPVEMKREAEGVFQTK